MHFNPLFSMKKLLFSAILALGFAGTAQAQVIYSYWGYNDNPRLDLTAVSTGSAWDSSNPVLTAGGTGNNAESGFFTETNNGNAFTDFGGTSQPAGGMVTWAADSRTSGATSNSTGNFFQLSLTMTNLEDLSLTYQLRRAQLGSGNTLMSGTSLVEYSLDGGTNWTSTGLSNSYSGSGYQDYSLDFSSVNAIEGQSNVLLRINLADVESAANATNIANSRLDNLQITATVIPEPSTFALLASCLGLGLVMSRRRRTP